MTPLDEAQSYDSCMRVETIKPTLRFGSAPAAKSGIERQKSLRTAA
jgi:hypothetical protein